MLFFVKVNLEIEMNGQKLAFSVSPIHAAVIMKFQERDEWSLSELTHALKMCSFALRKKLAFWKAQGLICEKTSVAKSSVEEQQADTSDEIYCVVKESAKLGRASRLVSELEEEEHEQDKGMKLIIYLKKVYFL